MTFETAEELLGRPDAWPNLQEAELAELVSFGSWLAAVKTDENLEDSFESLYAHVVENLSGDRRRQIVVDLGGLLETFGREHGTCPVNVLRHWLLSDPDVGVVSTAALTAAQVMPPPDDDPLAGPKLVLRLALEASDSDRQGAMVTGLATFGEAEVLALIDQAWDSLAGDAQSDVLLRMGRGAPTLAVIEFLVSRLERAADTGDQGPVGHVVASLVRLRHAADQRTIGGVRGVPEIDRLFPSWGGEEHESPIVVREVYATDVVGERIAARLQRAAAEETYPRLLPLALRTWGLEDAAFMEGLRRAILAAAGARGASGLLGVPVAIEPLPDWDRDDAVITWGILNPFGPTKVQICRVSANPDMDALVYTLHNPIGPICLLLGTVQADDAGATALMLLELASRFHFDDRVLLKSLPHWAVAAPAAGGLDASTFFRTAHAAALGEGLATDGDIKELIRSLRRLRLDAKREVHEQLREAMSDGFANSTDAVARASVSRVAEPPEAYERWFDVVSDAGHVTTVSAHFIDCWNAALRFQRDAGVADRDHEPSIG